MFDVAGGIIIAVLVLRYGPLFLRRLKEKAWPRFIIFLKSLFRATLWLGVGAGVIMFIAAIGRFTGKTEIVFKIVVLSYAAWVAIEVSRWLFMPFINSPLVFFMRVLSDRLRKIAR